MADATAASAASVAAGLLAFYRDPASRRPRYLSGRDALPDGRVVFRLALGRLPPGWLRDMPAEEVEAVRAAACAFVRQVCLREQATHYQVLCLPEDADRGAVRRNYQLLMALVHPDRDAASSWPNNCVQHANRAYETLIDPQRRESYDAGLAREHAAEAHARAHAVADVRKPRTAGRRALVDVGRRVMLLAGVVSVMFVVQAWWVGSAAPEHSLLERSYASARWVRDALPDPPRFLSLGPSPDAFAPLRPLEPRGPVIALRAAPTFVESSATSPDPPRSTLATMVEPPSSPLPAQAPAPQPRAFREAAEPVRAAMPALGVPVVQPPPPMRVAQAAPKSAVAAGAATNRDEVELIVALLVGYYVSGDSERLVGLIDDDALGWWKRMLLRSAYANFFSETRQRRLRIERLAWESTGPSARARGEARLLADYVDGRAGIDRSIPLEVDIEMRAGKPRITRLVLFPEG